jgi:hypothetical protein
MLFTCAQEAFTGLLTKPNEHFTDRREKNYLALLLALLLWLAVLLIAAQYLWNGVLVKIVTVVKPVTSVFQLLGLVILMEILMPK